MAGVNPDDIGLVAVPGTGRPIDVELRAHRLVGQQRRYHHRVTAFAGELVGRVAGAAEKDPELATGSRARHDVRVLDLVVLPVMREALVGERVKQDFERLVVALARFLDGHAALERKPAVPPPDAELIAAVGEQIEGRDLRGQNGWIVVRQYMHQRAKLDTPGTLRALGEERERIRRGAEFR